MGPTGNFYDEDDWNGEEFWDDDEEDTMDLLERDDTPEPFTEVEGDRVDVMSELFDLEAEIDAAELRQERIEAARRELAEAQTRLRLAEQQSLLESRLARCLSYDVRRALSFTFEGRYSAPMLLATYRGDRIRLTLSRDGEPSAWSLTAMSLDRRNFWNGYHVDGWQNVIDDGDLQEVLLRGLAGMRQQMVDRSSENPF